MDLTLAQQMAAIQASQMTQFLPPIQIQPAQLVAGVEALIRLPGLAGILWLPPTWVLDNGGSYSLISTPANLVIGVRINLASAPMLPWGLAGNNISSFTGPVEQLYVTLLSGVVTAPVTLLGARGIGVGYSTGQTAAGTPATGPSSASGGSQS